MELIGRIDRRKIYYVQIRNNSSWKKSIPKSNWVALTIVNEEDEELVPIVVKVCLDRNVSYTCSTGNYAQITENYFDEEIAWRGVKHEKKTNEEFDHDYSPITTSHRNFGEGIWFAAKSAIIEKSDIDKVVCIDFTKKKVKKHLVNLIQKVNNGWLPSDEEIESVVYDK